MATDTLHRVALTEGELAAVLGHRYRVPPRAATVLRHLWTGPGGVRTSDELDTLGYDPAAVRTAVYELRQAGFAIFNKPGRGGVPSVYTLFKDDVARLDKELARMAMVPA
jgi:hypothetical protein